MLSCLQCLLSTIIHLQIDLPTMPTVKLTVLAIYQRRSRPFFRTYNLPHPQLPWYGSTSGTAWWECSARRCSASATIAAMAPSLSINGQTIYLVISPMRQYLPLFGRGRKAIVSIINSPVTSIRTWDIRGWPRTIIGTGGGLQRTSPNSPSQPCSGLEYRSTSPRCPPPFYTFC